MAREQLQSYSVHETSRPAADRVDRAEALQFVKDGFLRQVFILPPAWLARHGIWFGVLAYVVAAGAIVAIAAQLALPGIITTLAFLALHLIFASEADEMLRAHLAARGWATVGHITGTGRLDCERRFYDLWLPSVPMSQSLQPSTPNAPPAAPRTSMEPTPATRATDARGLFDRIRNYNRRT